MNKLSGEINWVRIPRGVEITVGRDDASRLIETGKAELIREDKTSENLSDEQDATSDSSDMPDMNTEAENPPDERDATTDAPDMPDMNTEAETRLVEQMPIEQTVEISADREETVSETAVEVSDISDQNTSAGDIETNLQGSSSSEDTQTDDVGEAEIDETKPKT